MKPALCAIALTSYQLPPKLAKARNPRWAIYGMFLGPFDFEDRAKNLMGVLDRYLHRNQTLYAMLRKLTVDTTLSKARGANIIKVRITVARVFDSPVSIR